MSENDLKLIVKINGRKVLMHPFVQRIIRKTVLAMLSTLKGVEIKGEETVEIEVEGAT
ncbi:hypothetical protein KAU92_01295 [Candidatus Bathyarchaeota archaeon]|nr:hypothetical protein [Candidatus Bathyarchaeota archaeon]